MKLAFLVLCAIFGINQAATPKPTHEPNEYEQVTFYYNRLTHNLLMKKTSKTDVDCYVQSLTADQMKSVHSDSGLRTLEISMLGNANTASQVSMALLAPEDATACMRGFHNRTMTYFSL